MKLGFVSAIVPEFSFAELIDYASGIGMQCVEACCWPKGKAERRYAGVTHIDVDDFDAGEVRDILAAKGIELSGLGYYPNPLTGDLAQREVFVNHIKKCILAANRLGLGIVNTFVGKDPKKTVKENFAEFRKVWPEIIKLAEDKGVKIAIENCPMYFTMDEWPGGTNLASAPALWDEMFSIIPSDNFGLNLDPSHFVLQQMDYVKPILDYGKKIFHFHIKDVKFYREKWERVGFLAAPLEYHKPKLPGLGDIEWGRVFAALNDIGYDGCCVIEVEDRAYESTLGDKLKSIELSKRFISQYFA